MLCRIQKIPYRLREQFARSALYTKPDDIDLGGLLAILHTFSGTISSLLQWLGNV